MMTKADLKTGMIVTTKDGDKYMVFLNAVANSTKETDILVNLRFKGCWNRLCYYNEDLTYGNNLACNDRTDFEWHRKHDIVKVSLPDSYARFIHDIEEKVIWQREEVKEVTMAEVEEKFGCKVKIVS